MPRKKKSGKKVVRRKDSRTKVAPGIYRDHVNWYGIVKVSWAGFREKRFPIAAPIDTVQQWINDTRVKLLSNVERGATLGTFAHDAKRYVLHFTTHLASAKSLRLEVDTWIRAFGDKARGTIKPIDVARVRSEWLADSLAPKTINNRVNTLARLYRCLDGKRAWTPCDDLEPLAVHREPIRFVTNELILQVDAKLQALELEGHSRSQAWRARFRVLVSTGRRPSELMRAVRSDVDLQRRIWLVRDGKGGFSPGVYLNDDMLAAWEFFIEANAWGHYNTGRQGEKLNAAGWPTDVKPYNARHTVGITLSEAGVELPDVGAMMGHKRSETTRRHYVPVLNSRMQRASEALEGRFNGWPAAEPVQTGVQTGEIKVAKTRLKVTKLQPVNKRRKSA